MVNFFVKFLSEPTVVLGLVAMIGLIAMKNRPSTVIQGTMKTMLGMNCQDKNVLKRRTNVLTMWWKHDSMYL